MSERTRPFGNNRLWDLWGNNPFGLTGEFYRDLFQLAVTHVILAGLLFIEIVWTPPLFSNLLQKIRRLQTGAEEGQIGMLDAYSESEENLFQELQQVREQIPSESELDRSKMRIFVRVCLFVVSVAALMSCLIVLKLSSAWIWLLVVCWVGLIAIIVKPLPEDTVKFMVAWALRKRERVLAQALQEIRGSL